MQNYEAQFVKKTTNATYIDMEDQWGICEVSKICVAEGFLKEE